MNKKEFMKPSMMVVNIQATDHLLTASNDVGLHNEVSNNASYARENIWNDNDSDTDESIWGDDDSDTSESI